MAALPGARRQRLRTRRALTCVHVVASGFEQRDSVAGPLMHRRASRQCAVDGGAPRARPDQLTPGCTDAASNVVAVGMFVSLGSSTSRDTLEKSEQRGAFLPGQVTEHGVLDLSDDVGQSPGGSLALVGE